MSKNPAFVNGLIVKPPHPKAPDFVKCSISIKRQELIDWLSSMTGDWINLDVKESQKNGEDGKPRWYAQVNDWKPKKDKPAPDERNKTVDPHVSDFVDDDIPF